jgi:hypothetical protein
MKMNDMIERRLQDSLKTFALEQSNSRKICKKNVLLLKNRRNMEFKEEQPKK